MAQPFRWRGLALVASALVTGCSPQWGAHALPQAVASQQSPSASALYVANVLGNSIFAYEPGHARPARSITQGIRAPFALAEDGYGNLFVANAGRSGNGRGSVTVYAPGSDVPARKITAGIHGLGSMAVDRAGDLFVANVDGDTVFEYAPHRSTIERRITQGVIAVRYLAVDASGYLYVSNCQLCLYSDVKNTFTIYAPRSGKLVRTVVTRGPPAEIGFYRKDAYVDLYDGAIAVYSDRGSRLLRKIEGAAGTFTFDAAGDLYSAQKQYAVSGGRILVYAPGASTPAYTITKGLYAPQAIATDALDNLYVANAPRNDITVYAFGKTAPSHTITVATGIDDPEAIAFDAAGDLYTANTVESTVTIYAPGSSSVLRTITKGIVSPSALAFDAAGNLYVGNTYGNGGGSQTGGSITVYAPGKSEPWLTITAGIHGATYSLAFDAAGNLYVASGCPQLSELITVYAPGKKSVLRTIGRTGISACAIKFDSSGNLYAASVGEPGVVVIFPPGASHRSHAITRKIDYPEGLAFDSSGNLYVTNARGGTGRTFGSITVYPPGGGKLLRIITRGLRNGPSDPVFGPSGELYVTSGQDVLVYPPSGGKPRSITQGLQFPASLRFDRDGNLFVANEGKTQNGSSVTEYASGSDKLIRRIPGVRANPYALIFGPP